MNKKLTILSILMVSLVLILEIPKAYPDGEPITLIESISTSLSIPYRGDVADLFKAPFVEYAALYVDRLSSLKVNDRVKVSIGGVSFIAKTENVKIRSDGISWKGVPENYTSLDYILITVVGDYAFGTIQADGLTMKITPSYSRGIVEIRTLNPDFEKPMGDDVLISSLPSPASSDPKQGDVTNKVWEIPVIRPLQAENQASSTIVDVMVYYTPNVLAYFGSEGATRAAIQHLVDLTNQAYQNSRINLEVRLVYSQSVSYPDDGSLSQALDDLTKARGVFSDMPSLRSRYRADLVVLLRRFNNATNDACGLAWLLPSMDRNWADAAAFSVVQVGESVDGSRYYCSEFSFTHELGHNFGCQHDRAHASGRGIFEYSYGYIEPYGRWGTIMAYHSSRIPFFSNPNISYNGTPTGVSSGNPNSADNARTINLTKDYVASYRTGSGGGSGGLETDGFLVNISTRGYVGTGDSVMIAGFCIADEPLTIVIRALGPSLGAMGVYGTLSNPMFEIRDPRSGALLYQNDNWSNDPSAGILTQLGIQPSDYREAASAVTAYPGCYTVIVQGVGGNTGVALVEVFDITVL